MPTRRRTIAVGSLSAVALTSAALIAPGGSAVAASAKLPVSAAKVQGEGIAHVDRDFRSGSLAPTAKQRGSVGARAVRWNKLGTPSTVSLPAKGDEQTCPARDPS